MKRIGLYVLVEFRDNRQLISYITPASKPGLKNLLSFGTGKKCWIEALHQPATTRFDQRR